MHRVIYVSEATGLLDKAQINEIVKTSRRNNRRHELTGMLVHHEGRFFQVLEGPLAPLQTCMHRILKDPRHRDTIVIDQSEVNRRAFPGWRMGYSDPAELAPELRRSVFRIYDLIPPNSPERGEEKQVRNLVRDFLAGFEQLHDA